MRFFIAMLLSLLAVAQADAQCRNGRCLIPADNEFRSAMGFVWKVWPENPSQAFLYENGRCTGGYDLGSGLFREWDGQSWGKEFSPPVSVPQAAFFISQGVDGLPTGMDWNKLTGKETYAINGKPVSEKEMRDRLCPQSFQQIPDDGSKRHLTIVAKDSATLKSIKADLEKPPLSVLSQMFRTQAYDASDRVESEMLSPFRLADDAKFQKSGRMACIQLPSKEGKAPVFSCIYTWDGVDDLADFMRKADPNYDPSKNPGPKNPGPKNPPDEKAKTPADVSSSSSAAMWCCVAGGFLALLILNRRRES